MNVPPRYRDTMPWVIGVGAVGVASIGVGLWWRIRTGRTDAAPTVSVGSAGTLLGWAGRF